MFAPYGRPPHCTTRQGPATFRKPSRVRQSAGTEPHSGHRAPDRQRALGRLCPRSEATVRKEVVVRQTRPPVPEIVHLAVRRLEHAEKSPHRSATPLTTGNDVQPRRAKGKPQEREQTEGQPHRLPGCLIRWPDWDCAIKKRSADPLDSPPPSRTDTKAKTDQQPFRQHSDAAQPPSIHRPRRRTQMQETIPSERMLNPTKSFSMEFFSLVSATCRGV